ncbi:MAG: AAA family ATPase [Myxococcales bacterium]
MNAFTIACLGKGGTGKTLVSTLLGRIARDQGIRTLLVDADPVGGLSMTCGIQGALTVAEAREQIIDRVKALTPDSPPEETREIAEWMVAQALVERDGLAFLAMGQRRSLGCYCSLNLLLRKMIGAVVERFDLVVVDAEAGIEQVNREVVERVDQALLLSDGSQRAVQTCLLVKDTIGRVPMMERCRMGVLFNRVAGVDEAHRKTLEQAGLSVVGVLPADDEVSKADRAGTTLQALGPQTAVYRMLAQALKGVGPIRSGPSPLPPPQTAGGGSLLLESTYVEALGTASSLLLRGFASIATPAETGWEGSARCGRWYTPPDFESALHSPSWR